MDFGELIDEAAERGGLDPAALEGRHIESIRRSMEYVQIELETEGAQAEFRESTYTATIAAGAGAFSLPADAIDVTSIQINDGTSAAPHITLARENRTTWAQLAAPTDAGQPTIFWISKSNPIDLKTLEVHTDVVASTAVTSSWGAGSFSTGAFSGATAASLTEAQMRAIVPDGTKCAILWPLTDKAYTIQVSYVRFHAAPGNLSSDVDVVRNWLPTITAGLAAKIAQKWALDRYAMLQAEYQTMLFQRSAEQNQNPVYIGFRGHGFSRRRRH